MTAEPREVANDVDYLHAFADDATGCTISASASIHRIADRLAAADRENAELREKLGTERLVHALQEQRLATSMSFQGAPRWDEDRVVIEHGWLDGHCGRCGEAIPQPAERDELRGEVERLGVLAAEWESQDSERLADVVFARQQLAAAQAQLAEARLVDVIAAALCDQAEQAEASESEAWWAMSTDDVSAFLAAAVSAALSAAPQPEPTHFEITVEDNGALSTRPACQPEPPASDEPARCEHGETEIHGDPANPCIGPEYDYDCGPAASGTPDGGS